MAEFIIHNEQEMENFGQHLACSIMPGLLLFLEGELGAGKTTLVRGFLRGLGHLGAVKSPTYTLVESYAFADYKVHHFDLYRLHHPDELEAIGIRDYLSKDSVLLVEWAEKGFPLLMDPDLTCIIDFMAQGRKVRVQTDNPQGEVIINALEQRVKNAAM